jgi:hypothetical protein
VSSGSEVRAVGPGSAREGCEESSRYCLVAGKKS